MLGQRESHNSLAASQIPSQHVATRGDPLLKSSKVLVLQGESRKHYYPIIILLSYYYPTIIPWLSWSSHDHPIYPLRPTSLFSPAEPTEFNWTPEVRLMSVQGVCKSFNGCWTDEKKMSGSGDFSASGSFGSKLMPPKTIMIIMLKWEVLPPLCSDLVCLPQWGSDRSRY